ncbi:uncharacterized protein LOC110467463 [Mizuhopecten yessoensis]|uniref:Uncharacterized protein n=1 Tax=Mizuhopecten yessoensis TaxID=6573 RepID=A0A210PLQ4_MIZYE|nr:uncharacterized protein LOC110467463 [Mizuhopecten yessoensis]XP_021380326.1 uncharacterized protein LOC110467463 [Mizuhopecten yessoensis]XP_021380327.1 uncharacterized protein LOC110467463 [Mizuhopecten yessoensis]OWF37413.1 hypothetical protein KP79_PYT04746 [Mizuhopecten yessoensis]
MSGHLLKTYRSQEVARERNKREDRKLNLNLRGKNGPEAVYKLNLEKVNHEQRAIARELGRIRTMGPARATGNLQTLSKEQSMAERQLEKIRQGIHKPTNKTLLTPDKKFHHPVFNFTDIPVQETNTNVATNEMKKSKESMDHVVGLKGQSIDSADGEVDGFMIIKYLGDLHNNTQIYTRTPPPSERGAKSPVYRSSINQIDIDTPRLAFKRLTEIGKIESDQAEQSYSEATRPGIEHEVINSATTIDARSGEARGGVLKEGTTKVHREHKLKAGKHQKEHLNIYTSSLIVPETSLRSSLQSNLSQKNESLDLATLANIDMANVRNKVSKRLTKDYISGQGSALSDPGSNRKQNNRKGTTSAGPEISAGNTNSDISASPGKQEPEDAPRPRPERRMSKQQVDELLRKPVLDPDMYNADGSLKTMFSLPNFDSSYEEAKKARYIRTNEKLERDRELTTKEIFSHN